MARVPCPIVCLSRLKSAWEDLSGQAWMKKKEIIFDGSDESILQYIDSNFPNFLPNT